jgi:hypothetical protein
MWHRLITVWLTLSRQRRRRPVARRPPFRRPASRPRLESLEDRIAPAGGGFICGVDLAGPNLVQIDPNTGAKTTILTPYFGPIAVEADGTFVLRAQQGIELFNPATGQSTPSLLSATTGILSLAVGPNGQIYASTYHGGIVEIDPHTGAQTTIWQLPDSNSIAKKIAVEPDGTIVFFGFVSNLNGSFFELNPAAGQSTPTPVTISQGVPNAVFDMAVGPNGQIYTSGLVPDPLFYGIATDGVLKIDPKSGAETIIWEGQYPDVAGSYIGDIAVEGDGTIVLAVILPQGQGVYTLNPAAGEYTPTLLTYGWISHLAVAPASLDLSASLRWNSSDGGVDMSYADSDAPVPSDTTEALYWADASGKPIGGPIPGTVETIPAGTVVGTYGPFNFSTAQLGDPPQGTATLIARVDPDNLVPESNENNNDSTPLVLPDLSASLTWNTTDGGVDMSYADSNAPVPFDTTEALYWADASGKRMGDPIAGTIETISAGTSIGPSQTFHFDASALGTPPQGAAQLLAFVDPDNLVVEADKGNNDTPLILPDLRMSSLVFNTDRDGALANADHRGVDFAYSVNNSDLPVSTNIAFYWAASPDMQSQHELVQDFSLDGSSPSEMAIRMSQGPHDRNTDSFTEDNNPARWGKPPTWANYILADLDPDNNIIEAYTDTTRPYKDENVFPLEVPKEQQLLQGSVNLAPESGDDASVMRVKFEPGGGASLSAAEVVLGVDHFNWLQQVVHVPSTWEPRTLIDLDYSRPTQVLPSSGLIAYADYPKDVVDQQARTTPFLDPLATQSANDPPDKYTRAFVLRHDPDGPYDGRIIWYNVPPGPTPDEFYYYLREDYDPTAELDLELVPQSKAFDLGFVDIPRQPASQRPFEDAGTEGYLGFETSLVGVHYDRTSYEQWNGSGYLTNFSWKSNTVDDGSGGVFDYSAFGGSGILGLLPPPLSGGVFDFQLIDQPIPFAPLQLSPTPNQNILLGQSLAFTVQAQDAVEGAQLTYSLGPGAPAGAAINRTTGVFTWSPPAVGTYAVTVRVTDDGSPTLSEAETFTVSVIKPASLSGSVFADFNQDGQVDFGEAGISGVSVHLTGTDDLGQAVDRSLQTDGDGAYVFVNLRPGSYYLTKMTQPAGYTAGIDTVGTASGSLSTGVADQFLVTLSQGVNGLNYNYGERPAATGPIQKGQTAGIGFWNNKNGQALILALNGGGTSHELGDWLAVTFVNMYGANSSNDLAGKNNAYIAALFQQDFVQKGQKLDAQVLATALSVYATNATLDGTQAAAKYGFKVSGYGLGTATFNVGSNGDAFGVANNTTMTVLDLLLATDSQAGNGLLYYGNTTLRTEANNVFNALDQAGGIG